jgi:hypothetical protein
VKVKTHPTWNIPRCRVFRNIPTVFIHPNTSSIRFRLRWLADLVTGMSRRPAVNGRDGGVEKKSLRGSVTPFNLAIVYLGLADRARALDYLERACASDSQWLAWLKNDRILDPLRAEPRFVASACYESVPIVATRTSVQIWAIVVPKRRGVWTDFRVRFTKCPWRCGCPRA